MTNDKERIKEIILTDFMDNQLDEAEHQRIARLIEEDPELKSFYEAALAATQEPFEGAQHTEAPEHLWHSIKEEIETPVEAPLPILQPLRELWENALRKPRLSFAYGSAFAALACVIVISVITLRSTPPSYDTEEQVDYLMFLAEGSQNGSTSFGTTIENYFL